MARTRTLVSLVALVVLLASILWLARLEATGSIRSELRLPGEIPATLHLPESANELPAAVVLAHGFASDRAGMSGLARALTQAGYAVLTLDFRGHGANRNRFARSGSREDSLHSDLRAAVDFLRTSVDVDGARISVMGHSMGASATLTYAEADPGIDAAVMISGGRRTAGPHRPTNALFIYGAGDPARIRNGSAALAAEIAGVRGLEAGQTAGGFGEGTAVAHVEVARADHITILSSQYAARRIIDWLDDCYGVERGTFFLRADPRLQAALVGMLAFLFVLVGLGDAVGRLAPKRAERPAAGGMGRLLLLAGALIATLPLVAVGDPARVLPLEVGNIVVTHFFAAGVALLGGLVLAGKFDVSGIRAGVAASVGAALLGLAAVYLLFSPFGVVLHSLGLTPERAVVALGAATLIAPFQLVFQYLLRRGSTIAAAGYCIVGRVIVIGVLVVAVSAGVLSGVVMLMLPVLVGLFVLFEVLSSSVYARSRNYLVPALLESGWLAWTFAAVLPISL